RFVAQFVGIANFVRARREADALTSELGTFAAPAEPGAAFDVLLRPEQLRVTAGRGATVDAVEYFGHDAVYLTRLPGGAAVRVRVLAAPEFAPGDRVDLDYVGGPTVGYPRAAAG
ncbi:MAG: TOBE domain-containing protein, partial [Actinomycetes bacterium]